MGNNKRKYGQSTISIYATSPSWHTLPVMSKDLTKNSWEINLSKARNLVGRVLSE